MNTKIKKTKEKFEVVCDEGVIECKTLQEAEKKVSCLVKSESFGFVKKTIFDDKGQVLEELFCG